MTYLLLIVALLAISAFLLTKRERHRLKWGRKMSAKFIASPEFLQTPDWKRARYMALRANDGRCELCGRNKHDGVRLVVDHIKPRKTHPKLALDGRNLQILCDGPAGGCNLGKGNADETDWRHPSHPHRR